MGNGALQKQVHWKLWISSAFVAHALLCATVASLREMGPTEDLKISSTNDAIILHGSSAFGGFRGYVLFANWQQLQSYLSIHHLKLPELSLTQAIRATEVVRVGTRVLWKDAQNLERSIILTPDLLSAQILTSYIAGQMIEPSSMGFAIRLEKN